MITIPQRGKPRQTSHDTPEQRARRKAALVDLGLEAITRGDWLMVVAIDILIRRKGWSHD